MPELPEVESVRRQLHPRVVGRRILRVTALQQRRFFQIEHASRRRVEALDRRGKYLLARLEGELDLVMHLGMTGAFRFRSDPTWTPDRYVRATFLLDDDTLDFRDVRRFGRLAVVPAGDYHAIPTLAALGPEPLSEAFHPELFAAHLRATRMPVKPFLLTQRPVAGVGNIYADEALWRARIHPASRRVGRERAHELWQAIRDVLSAAIDREGTTFRDYQMVNGESGGYAQFLDAYGHAGRACARCATALRKVSLGGRGTTYCPRCQRH